ncbi:MAG: LytTR family transcriptional regulator DNA-binding domain-containing protein [Gammaproteobacteria bacterium]|jgi:hypothetical protein|nr:LytTR family transcriptional regulator DNA-binding domain-containing protein [Gammaproteobacteria bacterium]
MELAAAQQLISRPERRDARPVDGWIFFVLLPLALAVVLAMIGNRLIVGMGFFDGLGYMGVHMLLSWWSVGAGAWCARSLCRSWQPSAIALVAMGFVLALAPTALLFQSLGDLYANLYPVFAENRRESVLPELSLPYAGHFVRYSLPALALFLAGIFGYRFATGVDWLGYSEARQQRAGSGSGENRRTLEPHGLRLPLAGSLPGSRLPAGAVVTAIKAEQHYIRVWSDQGVDFLRYRFRDLVTTFAGIHAAPVHRSWWVNFGRVARVRRAGRSVELVMDNGLVVPVSLSHKTAVLDALSQHALQG